MGFVMQVRKPTVLQFILYVKQKKEIDLGLLCSKERIVSLEGLFIPRLELLAVRTLFSLMDITQKALSSNTKVDETKYWTDSSTVLY